MEDACQYIILQENFHDKYPHWNFYAKICFEKSRIDFSMVLHILTFRARLETAKDSTACEIHNVLLPWTFWVWIGTSWNLQFCFMPWKREERECTSPQKKKKSWDCPFPLLLRPQNCQKAWMWPVKIYAPNIRFAHIQRKLPFLGRKFVS